MQDHTFQSQAMVQMRESMMHNRSLLLIEPPQTSPPPILFPSSLLNPADEFSSGLTPSHHSSLRYSIHHPSVEIAADVHMNTSNLARNGSRKLA